MNDDDLNEQLPYISIDHYNKIMDDYSIPDVYVNQINALAKHYSPYDDVEETTLYAVKEQIEWASRVIVDIKTLTNDEIKLLRKVSKRGIYSTSDRKLLNELLTTYIFVRRVTIGKLK